MDPHEPPQTHPNPIKVLLVSSSFPPSGWGGAELAAQGIANWMSVHSHKVAVYTDSRAAFPEAFSALEEPRRYRPEKSWWRHGADEHGKKGAIRKAAFHLLDHLPRHGRTEFARAVDDFRPDLVMIHLSPGLGMGVFAYCAEQDLPVVYVMHDFWLTCVRSSMFSRAGTTCSKRELVCQLSSKIRWGALSKIKRLGIWAPSSRVMELAKLQLGDVFPRVLIERNVVDFADFRSTGQRPNNSVARFLYVGKVTAAKGVPFLLETLASLPSSVSFELDVVGSGDAEPQLKQLYSRDERIRFHGLCSRPQVIEKYHQASALVVPSIWFEPAGLVIYQAQVAGLPVIASDSGGIPELLAGRVDSMVLSAGDSAVWGCALRAFSQVPRLRAQMTSAASKGASEYQSQIDSGAARVIDFCEAIISQTS